MDAIEYAVSGAGLGLRREFMGELAERKDQPFDFLEVAPENWMEIGGALGKKFAYFTDRYPMMCHGLSLSLGSPAPLDEHFVIRVKKFLDKHNILSYSEHLSYCGDDGHLYDLMPIPFTEEAVSYVAARIKRVQEILERQLIIENASYYAAPGQEMTEANFTNSVLAEADCGLLLDVNNIYVNSINHGYDPVQYMKSMPTERIAYLHIAGHYSEENDLKVDTHGSDVIDPVWDLLEKSYQCHGVIPTLLERDFNIPSIACLTREVDKIRHYQLQQEERRIAQTS